MPDGELLWEDTGFSSRRLHCISRSQWVCAVTPFLIVTRALPHPNIIWRSTSYLVLVPAAQGLAEVLWMGQVPVILLTQCGLRSYFIYHSEFSRVLWPVEICHISLNNDCGMAIKGSQLLLESVSLGNPYSLLTRNPHYWTSRKPHIRIWPSFILTFWIMV